MTNCPAVLFGAPMPATPTIPHSGVWGTGSMPSGPEYAEPAPVRFAEAA
jgi:hypothetical protein